MVWLIGLSVFLSQKIPLSWSFHLPSTINTLTGGTMLDSVFVFLFGVVELAGLPPLPPEVVRRPILLNSGGPFGSGEVGEVDWCRTLPLRTSTDGDVSVSTTEFTEGRGVRDVGEVREELVVSCKNATAFPLSLDSLRDGRLEGMTGRGLRSSTPERSRGGPDLGLGWKKIPVGLPSGF